VLTTDLFTTVGLEDVLGMPLTLVFARYRSLEPGAHKDWDHLLVGDARLSIVLRHLVELRVEVTDVRFERNQIMYFSYTLPSLLNSMLDFCVERDNSTERNKPNRSPT